MIEVKLAARLSTVGQNVYYMAAPKKYLVPAIIFTRISTLPLSDLGGDLPDAAYVAFQVDVYDTDAFQAKTLAKAIRASLMAWQDPDVQCVDYTALDDSIDDTSDVRLFRVMISFRMFVEND